MNSAKRKIHANYERCLEKVANGGRAPSLKSRHQSAFGSKTSRISMPSALF